MYGIGDTDIKDLSKFSRKYMRDKKNKINSAFLSEANSDVTSTPLIVPADHYKSCASEV
jgi:hypothetical protein